MTTYHSRMMNIPRHSAGIVDAIDIDSFEQGHRRGHKDARQAAADIAGEADAEIARLQAQVAELQALSVTHIMIDIVPGDGSGEEVYAKSVADVEDLLSKLGELAEEADSLQARVDALAVALREIVDLCAVGDVDESTEALGWGAVIKDANAALAAAGR